MPCYKKNTAPSGYGQIGTTGYATEAECLQACKEGACCNGTTCSVRPQCQCNAAAGEVFKGVGTVCSPNPPSLQLTVSGFSEGPSGFVVDGVYVLNRVSPAAYSASHSFEYSPPCNPPPTFGGNPMLLSINQTALTLLWQEPLVIPSGSFAGQTRCGSVYAQHYLTAGVGGTLNQYLSMISCGVPSAVTATGVASFIPSGLVDLEEGLIQHPRETSSGGGLFSFEISLPPNPLP